MNTGSGKTLRLLIDIAEANSYLDTKAAQALGLNLTALKGADSTDVNQVQQTVVPGAKLGDLPMGDFPFMVLDASLQPEKPGGQPRPFPADGALTFRAFQNRLLKIDSPHHVIRVSEPQDTAPPCPRTCSDLVIRHTGNFGPVTITADGFTLNGQPVAAQLDTLFTGTMLIYPSSVEKLGLKKAAKAKHKAFFPFTQGGVKLARFDGGATEVFRDLPLMENAPLYFFTSDDHPPAMQFDVTVGMGLLSGVTASFDFKGMHLWMEPANKTP